MALIIENTVICIQFISLEIAHVKGLPFSYCIMPNVNENGIL